MSKLKPCPFCGDMRPHTCICGQKWAVRCDGCGALVISDGKDDGGRSAAKRWNARAAEEDRRTVRTCRNVSGRIDNFSCSECGCSLDLVMMTRDRDGHMSLDSPYKVDGSWLDPEFCPNCGRKVER